MQLISVQTGSMTPAFQAAVRKHIRGAQHCSKQLTDINSFNPTLLSSRHYHAQVAGEEEGRERMRHLFKTMGLVSATSPSGHTVRMGTQ